MKILPINHILNQNSYSVNNRNKNIPFKQKQEYIRIMTAGSSETQSMNCDDHSTQEECETLDEKLQNGKARLKKLPIYEQICQQYSNYHFFKELQPKNNDIMEGVQIDENGNLFHYYYLCHWGTKYHETKFPLRQLENGVIGNFDGYAYRLGATNLFYFFRYYPDGAYKLVKRDGHRIQMQIIDNCGNEEYAFGQTKDTFDNYNSYQIISADWTDTTWEEKSSKFDELYAKYGDDSNYKQ